MWLVCHYDNRPNPNAFNTFAKYQHKRTTLTISFSPINALSHWSPRGQSCRHSSSEGTISLHNIQYAHWQPQTIWGGRDIPLAKTIDAFGKHTVDRKRGENESMKLYNTISQSNEREPIALANVDHRITPNYAFPFIFANFHIDYNQFFFVVSVFIYFFFLFNFFHFQLFL